MKTILSICIFLICVIPPAFAASEPGPVKDEGIGLPYPELGIAVKDGLISMDVKDADITHVLKEIARKTKIDLTVDKGVEGKVSVKVTGVTIEDALKKLCANRAIVFEYKSNGGGLA